MKTAYPAPAVRPSRSVTVCRLIFYTRYDIHPSAVDSKLYTTDCTHWYRDHVHIVLGQYKISVRRPAPGRNGEVSRGSYPRMSGWPYSFSPTRSEGRRDVRTYDGASRKHGYWDTRSLAAVSNGSSAHQGPVWFSTQSIFIIPTTQHGMVDFRNQDTPPVEQPTAPNYVPASSNSSRNRRCEVPPIKDFAHLPINNETASLPRVCWFARVVRFGVAARG